MHDTDVVLIHGLTGTRRTWDPVVERLDPALRAHAIALPGHAGGTGLDGEPTLDAMRAGVERELDRLGLERPHLVGNSLGGWLALELAARGRAASVLALAPAGFWAPGDTQERRRIFERTLAAARRMRPLLGLLYRVPRIRRLAMADFALHGDRLTREQALEAADGALACTVFPALYDATTDGARRYPALPCPVRIRLGEHDRLFGDPDYGERARNRVPGADVATLPAVGHLPMVDDPALVAREIASSVRAASR